MIESCYWKERLSEICSLLKPNEKPPRWTERRHCMLERDIMIGFFIVRRLIELHKVSSTTRDLLLQVYSFPARGKNVTKMNNHRIEELYDLDNERHESKKPLYMSNQFIHSYTSFIARDETRNWSDVFIVSDYDRNLCIWRVPVKEIARLFVTASKDYPHSMRMTFDEAKGDYKISTN